MTQEGQGPVPEQTPAPPASTRWAEDETHDEDSLVPPFVHGRTGTPDLETAPDTDEAAPADAAPVAGDASTDEAMPDADGIGEPAPPDEADEPFPFEMPWDDEPEPTAEPAIEAGASVEAAIEVGPPADDEADATMAEADGAPLESVDEPAWQAAAEPDLEETGAVNDPWTQPWASLDEPESPESPEPPEQPEAGAGQVAVLDVAARLDRLSDALREDGLSAVEAELASPDRLTSLLAAVLAGYLTGKA